MYRKLMTVLAVGCFITGCGKGNEARKRLEEAKTLYETQQYIVAKLAIDSIHILFPREIEIRKQALTLMRLVERGESERNIAFCDSLIPICISESDDMKKDFVFEKNDTYDRLGKYIWKTMTVERNVERSYIRCGVDETGEMYIASVYFGRSPINHTGLSFSANDGTHAETPAIPYDGGVNYRFQDLGNTTEVVTYKGNNCKSIAHFLMFVNEKERIKATYTGGKPFSLYLADADKKAIQATYELALVLTTIDSLQAEKARSEKKIMLIDQKLN